ncbi:MAG: hypothetical protein AAFR77_22900 [Cyanobacteria bacterium J06631_2]
MWQLSLKKRGDRPNPRTNYHTYFGWHHDNDAETGNDDFKVVIGADDFGSYVNANTDTPRCCIVFAAQFFSTSKTVHFK